MSAAGRIVLILSGPSGVGKTTICQRLLERGDCVMSVSATTRPPRGKEQDGVDYQFLSEDEFRAKVAAGEFLEWAEVHHKATLYGTLEAPVRAQLERGMNVLLDIDVQGAAQLRAKTNLPQRSVFIHPPSPESLRIRLEGRKDTSPEEIERRMETARRELEQAHLYDVQVVNEDLEQAISQIMAVLDRGL